MIDTARLKTLADLKEFAKQNRIRMVKKPASVMVGMAGMHIEKGEDWGLKIPPNTIWIDQNLRGRELFRTLKHELEEMEIMVETGAKYWQAHKRATKDETR